MIENAAMNVIRYSASGTTQSNGADTTSVARCCVTPSSSADGTSARTIHNRRVLGSGFWVLGSRFAVLGSGFRVQLATHVTQRPHHAHPRVPHVHAPARAGDSPEPRRPAADLNASRRDQLKEQISQQSQQASGVARGVQKVRILGFGIVRCARTIAAEAGPWPTARRTAGRRCRPVHEAATTAGQHRQALRSRSASAA